MEKAVEKAILKFYKGSIGKHPVVAVYSGVCKVNAIIAAQILIDEIQVTHMINAGTAGGTVTILIYNKYKTA